MESKRGRRDEANYGQAGRWMSCETGLSGRAIRNRDTNSKQSLWPAASVFRKAEQVMCKLCNGSSPIPKAIKQPVWSMLLLLLLLVVHQLELDSPSRFQVVGKWQSKCRLNAGRLEPRLTQPPNRWG